MSMGDFINQQFNNNKIKRYYDIITYGKNKMRVLQAENTSGMSPHSFLIFTE